jgi:hypothetical protein
MPKDSFGYAEGIYYLTMFLQLLHRSLTTLVSFRPILGLGNERGYKSRERKRKIK